MFVFCSNKCKVMHLEKNWNMFILWLMASTLWVRKGIWESLGSYNWFPEDNLLIILVWTKRRKKKSAIRSMVITRKALHAQRKILYPCTKTWFIYPWNTSVSYCLFWIGTGIPQYHIIPLTRYNKYTREYNPK